MTELSSVRVASSDEWHEAFLATPGRTFFQSVRWAELWVDYHRSPVLPVARRYEFDDGLIAIVPLVSYQRKTHRVRAIASSIVGTYGGVLAPAGLPATHRDLIGGDLAGLPSLAWVDSPFNDCGDGIGSGVNMSTRVVRLDEGFDAARARMSKGHRSALAQARRSGVAIRQGGTAADWADYYELYRASLRRWGRDASSRYRRRLFDLLRACDSDVELWLAEVEDRPVAGAVLVSGDRYLGYWHGAAVAEAFHVRAVNLLLSTAMHDACGRGVTLFDLLPSGGHDGVEAFKRSFGAERLDVRQMVTAVPHESALARGVAAMQWASSWFRS